MTPTKATDLEQDALSILGCTNNLIEAIRERDETIYNLTAANKTLLYEVKELRLKLEQINH
tara:strand:+ start:959 stop:1141 length:183 start_codon:yes stop_codon:yes gene_type:complete